MSKQTDFIEKARTILTGAGILYEPLDCSGEMAYRGTTKKPHSTTGRYIFHLDERPVLWFCNRHNGDDETGHRVKLYSDDEWFAMTEAEREAVREKARIEQEEARKKRKERAQEAAKMAKEIFSGLPLAMQDNAYLSRKGVIPMGDMREEPDGRLVLPMLNSADVIVSLQHIAGDSEKRFLSGGEKKGCYYPIPAKDGGNDGPLLIGEGVATVLSCCMATGYAGLVAFDAYNLLPVAQVAREKYAEWEIIICADNDLNNKKLDGSPDNPGKNEAEAAAQAVGAKLALCPSVGGQNTDFNDLHVAEGLERVRECIEAARVAEVAPPPSMLEEGPMPLRRKPEAQAPYPVNALIDFADTVRDVAAGLNVSESMAGNSLLGVLCLLTQAVGNVKSVQHPPTPLSLFMMSVAESGDGKSTVDDLFMKHIRKHEKARASEYKAAYVDYIAEKKAYDIELAALEKKKMTREERAVALKELQRLEPKMPTSPLFTIGDTNLEGVYKFLNDCKPHIGIFTDEGARLFGGTAFSQENVQKTIGGLTAVWSGKELDKMRHGEGVSKLYDRRICSHIMMQPIIAEKLFSDALLREQGFMCRQLVAWPSPMMKSSRQVYVEDLPSVQKFYQACDSLLCVPLKIEAETGGIIFDEISLTVEAQEEYDRFHDYIEENRLDDGKYSTVNGYAKRAAEQALRIAGILALAHNPASRVVDMRFMDAGITLAIWYLEEVLRIVLDDMASPEILEAEKLLEWCKEKRVAYVAVRQILRVGPNSMREKKHAEKAISVLEDHGWLVPTAEPVRVWMGGKQFAKSKKAWAVRSE